MYSNAIIVTSTSSIGNSLFKKCMCMCTILVYLLTWLIQGTGWILIPWSARVTSVYFSILELISKVDSSKYKVLYPLLLEVKTSHAFMCFFSSCSLSLSHLESFTVETFPLQFLLHSLHFFCSYTAQRILRGWEGLCLLDLAIQNNIAC